MMFLSFVVVLSLGGSLTDPVVTTGGEALVTRFGGDLLLAGHYETAAGANHDMALKKLVLLQEADVAMVNLESPVTTRGTEREKPYTFRMHPRYLSALTSGGIDIVSLANNHIFDYDSTGLFDTIHYLDSVGIAHVGAGRNRTEAHRPVTRTIRGITVAFFGYYQGGEAPSATASSAGVAERSLEAIARDISEARLYSDYIVVTFHWGKEKATIPEAEHVRFAHAVIELGADVIVGHHPHVLQGIEVYKGGLIAYSLGNLVFGGNSRRSQDTALLEVSFTKDGFTHRLLPVRIQDWVATELTGAAGEALVEMIRQLPITDPSVTGETE